MGCQDIRPRPRSRSSFLLDQGTDQIRLGRHRRQGLDLRRRRGSHPRRRGGRVLIRVMPSSSTYTVAVNGFESDDLFDLGMRNSGGISKEVGRVFFRLKSGNLDIVPIDAFVHLLQLLLQLFDFIMHIVDVFVGLLVEILGEPPCDGDQRPKRQEHMLDVDMDGGISPNARLGLRLSGRYGLLIRHGYPTKGGL